MGEIGGMQREVGEWMGLRGESRKREEERRGREVDQERECV